MDQHTLELLEFTKIRELLTGFCATSLGRELARHIEPLPDVERIRRELRLVTEMTEALSSGLAPPLGGLTDIRMLVRRAAIGSMLTASELLEVRDVLLCTGQVYRYRMRLDERWSALSDVLVRVEDLGLVAKSIEGSLDSRGSVLDMASSELAGVRQQLKELDEKAQEQVRRLLRDPELRKILRYQNATMSGDHYLLPVAINHRHRIQGVVHRTSSTGETVFIEPASLARLSAERVVLKSEEEREVARVLRKLTAEVAHVSRPLQTALDVLAQLDLAAAKARLSLEYRMSEPDLNTVGRLWLRAARHPLLEHIFRGDHRQVVPIDVRLGLEFNMLVITGPNTGGKTVALKTAGLLSLMTLAGMHIPAGQGSQVPLWRHVLADIGDEQSLEQSLSTFSSHVSRIADILRQADGNSLVLLDELGAGTDPTEGAALGRAILDELDRLGCRAMVTTHLGDLKTYAFANDRAENAAVEFDVETLRPTYHLCIGQFGMSNALKIARRLQLPRHLLRRANHYLRRRQRRTPELLKLQQAREEAERARQEALEAELRARQEKLAYEQRLLALERETEEQAALQTARSNLKPGDAVRLVKLDQPGQIVRVDIKRNLAVVKAGIGQWEVSLEEVIPL